MEIEDARKAAFYADRNLASMGLSRDWVWRFWHTHVEDKRARGKLLTDSAAFVSLVIDCQRFVFGDDGDAALGVDFQPATEREMDGHLGPMTLKRMVTYLDWVSGIDPQPAQPVESRDYLIYDGEPLYIDGNVPIVALDHPKALTLGEKGSKPWGYRQRHPSMLSFGHWDVCTSTAKAHRILKQRKLATSGGIDNPSEDGRSVFYQFLDPGKRYGFHGGNPANHRAVFSYDLCNAVSKKYAKYYEEKIGTPRPTLQINQAGRVGRGTVFLGMYAAQIHTLLYILKALSDRTGFPLVFPHKQGVGAGFVCRPKGWKGLWSTKFRGCATHRDSPSTSKWDVRGLQEQIVVMLLRGRLPMSDFPSLVEDWRLHDEGWGQWLDDFFEHCRWQELDN